MIAAFIAWLFTACSWPASVPPMRDTVVVLDRRPRRPGGPLVLACVALVAGCAPSSFTTAVRYSAKLQNELCEVTGDALLDLARAQPARVDALASDNDRLARACALARGAHVVLEQAATEIAAVAAEVE